MKKGLIVTVVIGFIFNTAMVAFAAAEPDYSREINALKQRIAELEDKMKSVNKTKPAALPNGLDRFTFGGDFRMRSVHTSGQASFEERVRLTMKTKVNEDLDFNVKWVLMKDNQMGTTGIYNDGLPNNSKDPNMSAGDKNILAEANATIKHIFGSNDSLTVGRFGQDILATKYWNAGTNLGLIDGVKLNTRLGTMKATVGYANWSPLKSTSATTTTPVARPLANTVYIDAQAPVSPVTTLYGVILQETNSSNTDANDFGLRGIGIKTQIAKNLSFLGDYTRNYMAPGDPKGMYYSLRFRGADDDRPHSWGVRLDYHLIEPNNVAYTGSTGQQLQPSTNIKGPGFSLHYSPMKNSLLEFYQSFNTKKADGSYLNNYSRLQWLFSF